MEKIVIAELKRVIDKLEEEQGELQKQVSFYEEAITTIEDMIQKLQPSGSQPVKFNSVSEAVRGFFSVNMDAWFTSGDVTKEIRNMADAGQLKLKKNQKLNNLVRSSLYILSEKKNYLNKRPSQSSQGHEYSKPFSFGK